MASAGFFGIGNGVWQIVALVVSLAIMVMGVAGGIEKANKVMMPVLFGLFLVLAIYIGTLPGASEGYKGTFLTLNPAGLLQSPTCGYLHPVRHSSPVRCRQRFCNLRFLPVQERGYPVPPHATLQYLIP